MTPPTNRLKRPEKNMLPIELKYCTMKIYRKEQDLTPLLNEVRNSTIEYYDAYLAALLKPLREAKDYADKWKNTAVGFRALADAISKLLEDA